MRKTEGGTVMYRVGPHRSFTGREREVLALLATGMPTRAMADGLFLSVKTVESHYLHLRQKLGLASLRQLIVFSVYHAIYHR